MESILLVEDYPDDEALSLYALKKNHVTNEAIVARDENNVVDFIFRTGNHADRDTSEIPQLILPDLKICKPIDFTQFVETVKQIGTYWSFLNQQWLAGGRQ